MKTKQITILDLAPVVKELNTVYNGHLEPLQAALIKGSFYATFNDPYEREKLRPISDRIGKISTAFIREGFSHFSEAETEKLAGFINKIYLGNLKYLLVELEDTAELLQILKTMKVPVKLSGQEIDIFIYHIKIFIRALKKLGSDTQDHHNSLPAFDMKWYNSN